MDDDQLEERLWSAARAHNHPPETPREAMWDGIQRARLAATPHARLRRAELRWLPVAVAAAALLATGIGIGRLSTGADPVSPSAPIAAGAQASASGTSAYRLAALEHLSQSEEFLTLFRTAVRRDTDHHGASATARRLLTTNRLLLDSPAATDRQTRLLLEDLELVLAGITQLSARSAAQDLELVREGIERGNVMPRLRTAVPAGAAPTQGVL
jgi:hypothetical protein